MELTLLIRRRYLWGGQVGMLAGPAVYVYAEVSDPTLSTQAGLEIKGILSPQLLVAFIPLGVMPFELPKFVMRLRSTALESPAAETSDRAELAATSTYSSF